MKILLNVLALGIVLAPSLLMAAPQVPCVAITRYATVTDPRTLSFAPDGTLYVGRDNSGSGGGPSDSVKIHRVGPAGSPIVEFGSVAIADPDGVVYDAAGTVSGLAGSVLVGSSGKFSRIAPNGTVSLLHSNAAFPGNPTKMIFDGPGRLLFVDSTGVGVMTSATPGLLGASGNPLLAGDGPGGGHPMASCRVRAPERRGFSLPGRGLGGIESGELRDATFKHVSADRQLGVCQGFGTSRLNGLLDEIKLYGCALSASQIADSAGLPDPSRPTLNIARLTGAVQLTWTTNAIGYLLETNSVLTLPTGWGVLTSNYSVWNTNYPVTNAVGGANRFYRLRK